MDSPSDLSPNAPPAGFDDPFKTLPENAGQSHQGTASTEGSVDSSGFEKVDHDVLEEYGHNFAQQMQQSIFGQLPDDPDGHEDDFVIITSETMEELPGVELLRRIPAEIDKPYTTNLDDEISPRHQSVEEPHSRETPPSPAPRMKEASPEPQESQREHEHLQPGHLNNEPHGHHHEPNHGHHGHQHEPHHDHLKEHHNDNHDHHHEIVHPVEPETVEETDKHSDSFNMEQMQHHQDHHRVPQDAGDLIDIPRNVSPVHDLDYNRVHHESYIPREDSPLVPEPVSHHKLPEPHFEEHHPEPVHHHVPEPHHPSYNDDLLDFGQQAKELVDEAVHEAGDKIYHEEHKEPIFGEPHAPGFTEEVQQQINTVHNEVDDVLESMNENDDFQEVVKKHHKEPDEEPEPDFRRTPEPEEIPHQRHGPLTIPEISDQQEEEELLEDVPVPPTLHDYVHKHSGFGSEPRPPTPPKEISEEDFKPSLVNLGQRHPTHAHTDSHHSILKHSPGHAEPWFDFKKVDPCLRVGLWVSLVASVAMTAYAVGTFSKEAIKQRKEVLDLVYWRDPKKSAIALSLSLLAVFIVAKYPLLSILSYSGLAVLAGTLGFRIFKAVEGQIKKTGGENPFQDYLNKDLILPQEKVHAQVDILAENLTCLATKTKKLVFVENIFESVKFVLLLWSLTYVSAWFSGFALVILTVLGLFTIPKVYETYQEPIDQQLAVISGHVHNVIQLVEEKLPFLKRAAVEAEKKDQ